MTIQDRKSELLMQIEAKEKEMVMQSEVERMTSIELPKAWKVSKKGMSALKQAVGMNYAKHSMYSSIPMLCQGVKCPYASVCPLIDMDQQPDGERCPLEIAMILKRYDEYCSEFRIDETNIVDMSLVKDLIDFDVQVFRAENRMAVDGDFIEEVVVSVTDKGETITNPQISKASEYKERIMSKKHKVLELMNSTRKDKAGDKLTVQLDPSSYASQLMQQMNTMSSSKKVIEADYEEVNN